MMALTFTMGKALPQDLATRGASNSAYKPVYDKVLALPMSTDKREEWMEIGGLPDKIATARLQACLNPSVSKQGKHHPRAYQASLWEQNAKVITRRQEHKDGTFSLWVKKVKRDK